MWVFVEGDVLLKVGIHHHVPMGWRGGNKTVRCKQLRDTLMPSLQILNLKEPLLIVLYDKVSYPT
jgi:hypothetical protein